MNLKQGFSWAVLLLGIGMFLTQAGEIIVGHDNWQSVFSPHGFGDLMRVAGAVIVGVLGALGIRMVAQGKDAGGPKPPDPPRVA